MASSNEETKERCIEAYREEKKKNKRYRYHNEPFRRKMNEDVNGNRKLFWKESVLFLCMAVRQFYGRRRKDLESGLYRWTTSAD